MISCCSSGSQALSGPLEARQYKGCGGIWKHFSVPLQGLVVSMAMCSCLENPVDRGAWWAAIHGVSESQTRLKRLSIACMHGHVNPAASHHLPACSLVRLHCTHTVPGISRNQRSAGAFKTHVSASSSSRDHPSCAYRLLVSLPGGYEGAGNPCRLRAVYKHPPCTRSCARCLTNVIVFITNITIFFNAEDKLDQKLQVAELQLPSGSVLSKGLLHSTLRSVM